jgi:hypothetical protein
MGEIEKKNQREWLCREKKELQTGRGLFSK